MDRRDEDIWRNPKLRSSPTYPRSNSNLNVEDCGLKHLWAYKPFVTSNKGHRDSSKGSNIGMGMDNSMGCMGICNNMVQDGVADGIG